MTTIYNHLNQAQPVLKGLVEIINMHDYNYYLIALDGEVVEKTYKSSYEKLVTDDEFIQKCMDISGVDQEQLHFIHIDFEMFGRSKFNNYDMNNFVTYSMVADFIKNYHSKDFKNYVEELGIGLQEFKSKKSALSDDDDEIY